MADLIANTDMLNSWKEVATYLGRGVRTVQRWEQELGLPVRRPRGKTRSAVIAFRSELDQWLQHTPSEVTTDAHHPLTNGMNGSSKSTVRLHDNTIRLITRTQQLLNRSTELCERMNDMRDRVTRAVQLTMSQVGRKSRIVSVKSPPPCEEEPTVKSPALAG